MCRLVLVVLVCVLLALSTVTAFCQDDPEQPPPPALASLNAIYVQPVDADLDPYLAGSSAFDAQSLPLVGGVLPDGTQVELILAGNRFNAGVTLNTEDTMGTPLKLGLGYIEPDGIVVLLKLAAMEIAVPTPSALVRLTGADPSTGKIQFSVTPPTRGSPVGVMVFGRWDL